ncbi:MAG: glycosyltransferase, partial [Chloroflexi bacterium]|nr:glycosyltransferase [Chloroflexota bacterium]
MTNGLQHAVESHPLVSCIMPTANRRNFVTRAIKYFLRQDYEPKELVIVDDGTENTYDIVPDDPRIRYFRNDGRLSVGAKRNFACEQSGGEIIVHWDDDDWCASWRLSYQVENLLKNRADVCGLDSLVFYSPSTDEAWKYIYPKGNTPWLAGGTLCYSRSLWKRHPFPPIDIGEDARFVWGSRPNNLLALPNNSFYVAFVHPGNTSPKHTENRMWHPIPGSEARIMMGSDWPPPEHTGEVYLQNPKYNEAHWNRVRHAGNPKPLVTCLMATRDRRAFVKQSVKYFLNQDYPSKELLILDDGSEPVADLIPGTDEIRYVRMSHRVTLGEKRNLGVEASRGDIIVLWDDDDWHSPHRVSYQVHPIIAGRADATVLQDALLFDLVHGRYLSCEAPLREKMFAYGVIGGTVAFRKNLFNGAVRFPKANLAEDAAFLRGLFESRARVVKLPCGDSFVYIRHGRNTWSFTSGNSRLSGGWRLESPPSFVPPE